MLSLTMDIFYLVLYVLLVFFFRQVDGILQFSILIKQLESSFFLDILKDVFIFCSHWRVNYISSMVSTLVKLSIEDFFAIYEETCLSAFLINLLINTKYLIRITITLHNIHIYYQTLLICFKWSKPLCFWSNTWLFSSPSSIAKVFVLVSLLINLLFLFNKTVVDLNDVLV